MLKHVNDFSLRVQQERAFPFFRGDYLDNGQAPKDQGVPNEDGVGNEYHKESGKSDVLLRIDSTVEFIAESDLPLLVADMA